jgi:hypothetical protein
VPYGFALRFHAAHCAKYHHNTVQHPEGPFHFQGKINVSRCIDNIDLVVFPGSGNGRGGNGNAPFLFLFHKIHYSLPVMDFSHFMGNAGKEENTFRGGGFTRIDMGHDSHVSNLLYRRLFHFFYAPIITNKALFLKSNRDIFIIKPADYTILIPI